MAAMTASMYNAEMKQLYQRLTAEGKPHKVAVVAIMRKLIILANVLVRDDREWAPSAPAPSRRMTVGACGETSGRQWMKRQ